MTAPLPGLRRLYALGGAAWRLAGRLGDGEERLLARLEPALDRVDLVRDEAIEPLLAPSDGSAALERILERLAVPGGSGANSEEPPSQPRALPWAEERRPVGPETNSGLGEGPKARGSLSPGQRPGLGGRPPRRPELAPMPPEEGTAMPEQARAEAPSSLGGGRSVPPLPAEAARVAEFLSFYAPREGGAGGKDIRDRDKKDNKDDKALNDVKGVESRTVAASPPSPLPPPPTSRERGATTHPFATRSGSGWAGGGSNSHKRLASEVLPEGGAPLLTSPLLQPPPSQGGGTPRPTVESAPTRPGGEDLRARAARAGAGNAAGVPVCAGRSEPRIVRILERLAPPGSAPEASSESAAPAPGGSAPETVREPEAGALDASPGRRIRPAPRPVGGGLRALASLAGPAPAEPAAARPEPEGSTADRRVERTAPFLERGLGPLADGGAGAADLVEGLDRLLRREARRHGIEVDEP